MRPVLTALMLVFLFLWVDVVPKNKVWSCVVWLSPRVTEEGGESALAHNPGSRPKEINVNAGNSVNEVLRDTPGNG